MLLCLFKCFTIDNDNLQVNIVDSSDIILTAGSRIHQLQFVSLSKLKVYIGYL